MLARTSSAEASPYTVGAPAGGAFAVFGARYSFHTGSTSYEISFQLLPSCVHRVAKVVCLFVLPSRKTAPLVPKARRRGPAIQAGVWRFS